MSLAATVRSRRKLQLYFVITALPVTNSISVTLAGPGAKGVGSIGNSEWPMLYQQSTSQTDSSWNIGKNKWCMKIVRHIRSSAAHLIANEDMSSTPLRNVPMNLLIHRIIGYESSFWLSVGAVPDLCEHRRWKCRRGVFMGISWCLSSVWIATYPYLHDLSTGNSFNENNHESCPNRSRPPYI